MSATDISKQPRVNGGDPSSKGGQWKETARPGGGVAGLDDVPTTERTAGDLGMATLADIATNGLRPVRIPSRLEHRAAGQRLQAIVFARGRGEEYIGLTGVLEANLDPDGRLDENEKDAAMWAMRAAAYRHLMAPGGDYNTLTAPLRRAGYEFHPHDPHLAPVPDGTFEPAPWTDKEMLARAEADWPEASGEDVDTARAVWRTAANDGVLGEEERSVFRAAVPADLARARSAAAESMREGGRRHGLLVGFLDGQAQGRTGYQTVERTANDRAYYINAAAVLEHLEANGYEADMCLTCGYAENSHDNNCPLAGS